MILISGLVPRKRILRRLIEFPKTGKAGFVPRQALVHRLLDLLRGTDDIPYPHVV